MPTIFKKETLHHHNRTIRSVQFHIDRNLHQPFDLKILAEHACISYSHLRDIFEIYQKETLWSYVQRLRIEKAIALLSYTNQSLSQIAESVGYKNKHSLSKVFKEELNISPGKFKANNYFNSKSSNAYSNNITDDQQLINILSKQIDVQYKKVNVFDLAFIADDIPYVGFTGEDEFCPDRFYTNCVSAYNTNETVVLSLDNLNFTDFKKCRVETGYLIRDYSNFTGKISKSNRVYQIENGPYWVFEIPNGFSNINEYTFLIRDALIGYQKNFVLNKFERFLLIDTLTQKGYYYLYAGH